MCSEGEGGKNQPPSRRGEDYGTDVTSPNNENLEKIQIGLWGDLITNLEGTHTGKSQKNFLRPKTLGSREGMPRGPKEDCLKKKLPIHRQSRDVKKKPTGPRPPKIEAFNNPREPDTRWEKKKMKHQRKPVTLITMVM